MLVMLGFDCDEYLPLCEPYLNPITGTLRVVPEGAELLHYEHMGFQSKYAGELNLRFVAGELVGVEPIADAQQPQDGLLDLAELGPGGKEGWLERQWKRLRGYEPKPIPADVKAMLEMDESKPRPNVPCAVCGAIVAEAPWGARVVYCAPCVDRLLAIGGYLKHWHALRSKFDGSVSLSQRRDQGDDAPLDPEWHAYTRLYPFGTLEYGSDDSTVRLRIRGAQPLQSRISVEVAGDDEQKSEHRRSVLSAVTRRLEKRLQGSETAKVWVSYQSGITVTVRGEVIVTAETRRGGAPRADAEIAAELLEELEQAIGGWHSDLATIERALHDEVPALVARVTPTPVLPVCGELTPTDQEILQWVTRGESGQGERVWAVLPRHTTQGWVPGEKVAERYRKSVNL